MTEVKQRERTLCRDSICPQGVRRLMCLFFILSAIAGIWSLSRIADSDYVQAGWLLGACAVFAIVGLVFELVADKEDAS